MTRGRRCGVLTVFVFALSLGVMAQQPPAGSAPPSQPPGKRPTVGPIAQQSSDAPVTFTKDVAPVPRGAGLTPAVPRNR
jgi:hypothetical protein